MLISNIICLSIMIVGLSFMIRPIVLNYLDYLNRNPCAIPTPDPNIALNWWFNKDIKRRYNILVIWSKKTKDARKCYSVKQVNKDKDLINIIYKEYMKSSSI